jgi:prephenate dehydratase
MTRCASWQRPLCQFITVCWRCLARRTVASHPVALAQCQRFLSSHPHLVARAAYDTAGAAREIAAAGDPTTGAIASRAAAERYALEIVACDVEDRPDNQTRFLAIARHDARGHNECPRPDSGAPARSILVVTTDNIPGALLRVLEPLAERGINLSKLESRPTGEPWTYRFFLELEHAAGDANVPPAFDAVRDVSRSFRLLGTVAVWRSDSASS